MGRVAAPYAVKGWIKVQTFTEHLDSLLDYDLWWLAKPGGKTTVWQAYELVEGKVHGQTLLAQLRGVDDRNGAEALYGYEIAVDRDAFPAAADDEYYWDQLIGLQVVNAEGVSLGKVEGLLETGANDVFRVVDEAEPRRERLIPFVGAYVREVDVAAGKIIVDWGLDWGLED